jgi:hypothetical protein
MPAFYKNIFSALLILLILCFVVDFAKAQSNQKMMIIIIDGARYTETFGDPSHTYIPRMAEIAGQGALVNVFRNDGITYTSRAIPALWAGAWTEVRDTVYQGKETNYSVKPSIFEYYRKHLDKPASSCFYVLKHITNLWLPSFDMDYGPQYWPSFYSAGADDEAVCTNTKYLMNIDRPDFLWVYLADVDHAGHSGDWNYYTTTLRKADSIVGELWDHIQSHPHYRDKTTMIVTNDHGRHDDQHGGFQHHGCGCEGCRRMKFLAVGPNIKQNLVSQQPRVLPDMAVTAAHLLGFEMEYATGNVMHEIISLSAVGEDGGKLKDQLIVYPNPANGHIGATVNLSRASVVLATLINIRGEVVNRKYLGRLSQGSHSFKMQHANGADLKQGVYLLNIQLDHAFISEKIIVR